MKRSDILFLSILTLVPIFSFAGDVDEEVSKIFDRRQRQLTSPPKSLRARGAAKDDARFQEGLNRVQRRMSSTPEEATETDPTADTPATTPTQDDLTETKVNAPLIPAAARPLNLAKARSSSSAKVAVKSVRVFWTVTLSTASVPWLGLGERRCLWHLRRRSRFGLWIQVVRRLRSGDRNAYSTWGVYARKYFLEGP